MSDNLFSVDFCTKRNICINDETCKDCDKPCLDAGKFKMQSHKKVKNVYVPSEYSISENERLSAIKFIKKHMDKCGEKNVSYIFSDVGGIGIGVSIRCDKCGDVEDITDYSTF